MSWTVVISDATGPLDERDEIEAATPDEALMSVLPGSGLEGFDEGRFTITIEGAAD